MQKLILDTDIFSEVLKQRDPIVVENARVYLTRHRSLTLTYVSAHEMHFGLRAKQDSQALANLTKVFALSEIILPLGEDYILAAETRGRARTLGMQLALDDALIGAVATRLGLPVCTGNTSHYLHMRQAGLPVELTNWRERANA